MSFSRLLLVAANSKKFISGEGKDKVQISPKMVSLRRDLYEGEVILCFQLDDPADQEKRVSRSLGIPGNSPRCDGLVFYSQDGETGRVICLVEMKSTEVTDTARQIISTKEHIETLLRKECDSLPEEYRSECRRQITHIIWKACLYHHSASPSEVKYIQKELKQHGFVDVDHLTIAGNDLRPLLSGVGRSAKEMADKYKSQKRHKQGKQH